MNQATAMARDVASIASTALAERRREPAAGSVAPVLLLLDTRGHVRYCSDADALQRLPADITGRRVTELLDGLPLRASTPGYNVAYVRFAYAGGTRRQLALKLPSGGVRTVEVGVEPLWMDRGYCLLLQLRFICEAAEYGDAGFERQWGVRARAERRRIEIVGV